ncbi:alpha/beta hydrolase [Lysobacter sp. SG-8]|uniref:Alpha/beta hydrolase n=1 Tax=Marilutibacter penaei TaxID=2759900 RepID=A0A7W3YEZ1_9GAMM|nr:alpha/beta hydrolase [Lysobacter penaei]MBB1088622.1 alpha/beta hydrolase [Lysobacter penaei]
MFIVTNRDVDESRNDPGALGDTPNPKGPNELRLAEATRKGRGWHVQVLPDLMTPAMAREIGLDSLTVPGTGEPVPSSRYVASKILERINRSIDANGTVARRNFLFFIHGFNNDVAAALDRAERLEKAYGVEVLVYSWPANGGGGVRGTLSYKSDKRDALASVGALDRCFGRIKHYMDEAHRANVARIEAEAWRLYPDDAEKWDRHFTRQSQKACPFKLTLMTHSMGTYLFKHLLMSTVYRWKELIFDNVVLVAADTNNEDHAHWLDRMPYRNRIYVTLNENDSALKASRMKMGEHQKARLGHYPYELSARRVVYVDFTGEPRVADSHAYFEGNALKHPPVRRFFLDAFNGLNAEAAMAYDPSRNLHRLGR